MHSDKKLWNSIAAKIATVKGQQFEAREIRPVAGGDINRSYTVSDGCTTYFVKLNSRNLETMFEQEAVGLSILAQSHSILVPTPIAHGIVASASYLILSFHPIQNRGNSLILGQQLAALHRHTAGRFGWEGDNYIGSTLQHNAWTANWPQFWLQQRLLPQLEYAYRNGFKDQLRTPAERLIQHLPELLGDHNPEPSLLHGDLWGGNAAFVDLHTPIIYDPACYYGDRETDIAMTELFGGFGPEFYRGYHSAWPLPQQYSRRKPLYNLYHMLNHLNLFGGGYLHSCLRIIQDLC